MIKKYIILLLGMIILISYLDDNFESDTTISNNTITRRVRLSNQLNSEQTHPCKLIKNVGHSRPVTLAHAIEVTREGLEGVLELARCGDESSKGAVGELLRHLQDAIQQEDLRLFTEEFLRAIVEENLSPELTETALEALELRKAPFIRIYTEEPEAVLVFRTLRRIAREFSEFSEEEVKRAPMFIGTGGTIDAEGTIARRPSRRVAMILDALGIPAAYRRDVFKIPPDSTNIGPEPPYSWRDIFRVIREALEEKGQGLIDAGALTLPIVFTAAHSPVTEPESDALPNLVKSMLVATSDDTPPLVYVVIGNDIFLASNIIKLHVTPEVLFKQDWGKRYFYTFGEPAGRIIEDEEGYKIAWDDEFLRWARLYRKGLEKPEGVSGLVVSCGTDTLSDIALVTSLAFSHQGIQNFEKFFDNDFGYVEHIAVGYHTPPEVLRFYRDYLISLKETEPEIRYGLVIQGDFSRNRNLPQLRGEIQELTRYDIPVFTASKEVWEKTRAVGMKLIPAGLSYVKARTKMSYLLLIGVSYEDLKDKIATDYMGEITWRSRRHLLQYLVDEDATLSEDERQAYKAKLQDLDREAEFEELGREGIRKKKRTLPEWMVHQVLDSTPTREVIIGFPGMRARPTEAAVERLLAQRLLDPQKQLELVNVAFGDGNLPVGEEGIVDIFDDYLEEKYPELYVKFIENMVSIIGEERKDTLDFKPNFETAEQAFTEVLTVLADEQLRQLLEDYRGYDLYQVIIEPVKNKVLSDAAEAGVTEVGEKIEWLKNGMIARYPFLSGKVKQEYEFIHELVSDIEKVFEDLSIDEIMQVIETRPSFLSFLSQRVMKDAMMSSHPLLRVLGEAVDSGIEVKIKTKAFISRGNINIMKYPLGIKLWLIGAYSDEVSGRDILKSRSKSYEERIRDAIDTPGAFLTIDGRGVTRELLHTLLGIGLLELGWIRLYDIEDFGTEEPIFDFKMVGHSERKINIVAFSGAYVAEIDNREEFLGLADEAAKKGDIAVIIAKDDIERRKLEAIEHIGIRAGNGRLFIVVLKEQAVGQWECLLLVAGGYYDFSEMNTLSKIIANRELVEALAKSK